MPENPLKIVALRKGVPPLNDIAARLRWLADKIESGEDAEDVAACYVVVTFEERFTPTFYGFGHVAFRHEMAGIFTHCAQMALTNAYESDDDE